MENRKLRSLRALYKINQIDLAKLLGVTTNTYSSKERGNTAFTQSEMIKIVEFFKTFDNQVTMDDIFFIHSVT